jgi:hypothetical protein
VHDGPREPAVEEPLPAWQGAAPEAAPSAAADPWHLAHDAANDEDWQLVTTPAPPVEAVVAGVAANGPGSGSNGAGAPPAPDSDPGDEEPQAPLPGAYPAQPERYEIF